MGFEKWNIEAINRLKRNDKWYLGGGNKLIWAPAFPKYLSHPGLWDNSNFYDLKIDPGFTFHIIHKREPVHFKQQTRTWTPDQFVCEWESPSLQMKEEKVILSNDFLGEKVTLKNLTDEEMVIQVVVWTTQINMAEPKLEATSFVESDAPELLFKKILTKNKRPPLTVYGALALKDARSFQVDFSEFTGMTPKWELTPFYETLTDIGLPRTIQINGINQKGLIYFGLEREIVLSGHATESFQCGWSFDTTLESVKQSIHSVSTDFVKQAKKEWQDYYASVPPFLCSDPFINGYYPYRWYGLRTFEIDAKDGTMKYPAITEGLEYFRVFITYSAQCHILEERWKRDDSVAKGSILNFLNNQREDGSFAGHIYINGVQENGFYHADWGRVIQSFYQNHPDVEFIKSIYQGLEKYVDYFDRVRDSEKSGLYDVVDQFETGQEFMSRYIAVDEQADNYGWINNIRLKGVDATVYIYNLKKALGWMAKQMDRENEKQRWLSEAETIKKAVLKYMWDPEKEFFFDVDPKDFRKTYPKSAVCFYPYMTDIIDREHLNGLKHYLFDSEEFWSTYPITTVSMDDPYYNEYAHWKGKRHNCPWNGRVWPMTNSHIADVLGICARRFDDTLLRNKTIELIKKFIRMMHFEGDPKRPNCFEHYNPNNGKASTYRGVDDYQHSWVIELIMKYLVGIDFEENAIIVDPFPFDETFSVSKVPIKGKELDVSWDKIEFLVKYDGKVITKERQLKKVMIQL